MASAVPEGFHTVTPYFVVNDAAAFLEFLKRAFGATEQFRMPGPDGSIMHAQTQVGSSKLMLGSAGPGHNAMPMMMYLYVPDADAAYAKAVAGGGTSLHAPRDEFYGDRAGAVKDPFGNSWWIATHKEDLTHDQIAARAEAAFKKK
jgi:PhnB protein